MKCPECGQRGRCMETRATPTGGWRRRYTCTAGHRWSTLEQVVERVPRGPKPGATPKARKPAPVDKPRAASVFDWGLTL